MASLPVAMGPLLATMVHHTYAIATSAVLLHHPYHPHHLLSPFQAMLRATSAISKAACVI
jgi:hypothetical protein